MNDSNVDYDIPSSLAKPTKLDRNWYIGAYVSREIKLALQAEANEAERSLSKQLERILKERYQPKALKSKS